MGVSHHALSPQPLLDFSLLLVHLLQFLLLKLINLFEFLLVVYT